MQPCLALPVETGILSNEYLWEQEVSSLAAALEVMGPSLLGRNGRAAPGVKKWHRVIPEKLEGVQREEERMIKMQRKMICDERLKH